MFLKQLLLFPIFHFITEDNLPIQCLIKHDSTCGFLDSMNKSTNSFQIQNKSRNFYPTIYPNATLDVIIASFTCTFQSFYFNNMPKTIFHILVDHKKETHIKTINSYGSSSSSFIPFYRKQDQEIVILNVKMLPRKDCSTEKASHLNTHRMIEGFVQLLPRLLIG